MKLPPTKTARLYIGKLILRSLILALAIAAYAKNGLDIASPSLFVLIVWGIFMAEMILKHFPSRLESIGSAKQFAVNYMPSGKETPEINKGVALTAALWLLPNIAIGALHLAGIIPSGIMLLLSLAYSVCDMICVLFFCPFQKWLLKNRCCATCRIYNWDYMMMFTPLIFVPCLVSYTLVLAALALLLRWELTAARHPERFSDRSNARLRCDKCTERLCRR